MTVSPPENSLDDIRRQIDAIDDRLLDLMIERSVATGLVRATKSSAGTLAASPLRPAREAQMLRRLINRSGKQLDPELVVRLWRVILSSSTQSQAPVILHVDREIVEDASLRLEIAGHFCGMQVEAHGDIGASISALGARRGDLAIVTAGSEWAKHLVEQSGTAARLIGALPVLSEAMAPRLLVIGHVEPQPSGDDETILLTRAAIPSEPDLPWRWQWQSGDWTVSCLPGFLDPEDETLGKIFQTHADQSPFLAGRIPSSIETT